MVSGAPSTEIRTFGQALRRHRRTLDLSQEALAARAGLSPKHVGEIERGLSNPRLTTILSLLGALELRPTQMLDLWVEVLHRP